jgi:SAM-dependent methyltransferase/uncharacterized protein YbaR (Trm112 family)
MTEPAIHSVSSDLLRVLACPHDHLSFRVEAESLVCPNSHRFAIEDGIPVLTDQPRRERVPGNMAPSRGDGNNSGVDPFVNDWLVNTNGNLYWQVRGKLRRYPIPAWPSSPGEGKILVDIGCGWGRWTVAAARAGFSPIGMDVHLDALSAAGRVSKQLGVTANYVCSGADSLPFQSASIDVVFSYSVLQHLEKTKVARAFQEVSRVLKPDGVCLIQLPNSSGLYNLVLQTRRGFRAAKVDSFEMRYWSRTDIRRAMQDAGLQALAFHPDGFFSQNPRLSDLDLLSPKGKMIVLVSHAGCKVAGLFPLLGRVADSWLIEAQKPAKPPAR